MSGGFSGGFSGDFASHLDTLYRTSVACNAALLVHPKPVHWSWATTIQADKLAAMVQKEADEAPALPHIARFTENPNRPERVIERWEIAQFLEQFGNAAEGMLYAMSPDGHVPKALYFYKIGSAKTQYLRYKACEMSCICRVKQNLGNDIDSVTTRGRNRIEKWMDAVYAGSSPQPIPTQEITYRQTKKMARKLRCGKLPRNRELNPTVYGPLSPTKTLPNRSRYKISAEDVARQMAAGVEHTEGDSSVEDGDYASILDILKEEDDSVQKLCLDQSDTGLDNDTDRLPAPFPPPLSDTFIQQVLQNTPPWSGTIYSSYQDSDSRSKISIASTISSNMDVVASWEDESKKGKPVPIRHVQRSIHR